MKLIIIISFGLILALSAVLLSVYRYKRPNLKFSNNEIPIEKVDFKKPEIIRF